MKLFGFEVFQRPMTEGTDGRIVKSGEAHSLCRIQLGRHRGHDLGDELGQVISKADVVSLLPSWNTNENVAKGM